jgi:hypothetical protein
VITKAKATMAIATIEDLQGSVEVVVFPRLYETTRPTWLEGRILLVSGRVDHKGEEVSLLADLVTDWDDAVTRGPTAFASEVAAVDRSRNRGSNGRGQSGGWQRDQRDQGGRPDRPPMPTPVAGQPIAVGPGHPAAIPAGVAVSPLRGGSVANATQPSPMGERAVVELPSIDPGEPYPGDLEPQDLRSFGPEIDEPALPDEARDRAQAAASAPTVPTEASSGRVLHVRFSGGASAERTMEELRGLIRARPGATRVVLHVPVSRGGELPMELRSGVAYDADLLAEVTRRLGAGVELQLG